MLAGTPLDARPTCLGGLPRKRVNLLYANIAKDDWKSVGTERERNAGEQTRLSNAREVHHPLDLLVAQTHSHHCRITAMLKEVYVLSIARPSPDARAC